MLSNTVQKNDEENRIHVDYDNEDDLFIFSDGANSPDEEMKKQEIQERKGDHPSVFVERRRNFFLHLSNRDDFAYDENFARRLRDNFFEYIRLISNADTKKGDNEWVIEVPKNKIAFFFHDLLNFSEFRSNKKKNHNLLLLKDYLSRGFSLSSIYSDEWLRKDLHAKKRISYKFHHSEKICNARDTSIMEIDKKNYMDFVNREHLQGAQKANIRLGAYYRDKLVATMSFDKRRLALGAKNHKMGKNEYEMIRFCTVGNIPGIGSKLLNHFIENYHPEKIISYSDRRWGEGKFYEKIGFKYAGESSPSYFYTDDYLIRRYRFTFRKDVLLKKYKVDPKMTEVQIARSLGYDRIWDCGTNKYVIELSKKDDPNEQDEENSRS